MHGDADSTAIALLAGGRARRFPGKLEYRIDGQPMLARCYASARETGWPVYVCVQGSFARELDREIDAPLLVDRRPGAGPLAAFLDACALVAERRVFAVAADQPQLDAAVLLGLAASRHDGDEAVVPQHDGAVEPLAALYDRIAVLCASFELRAGGKRAMHDLIALLRTRFVSYDARYFRNVNRLQDVTGP
jgi:molybdopterin-guanine dinucleotide biosynthesis protein A